MNKDKNYYILYDMPSVFYIFFNYENMYFFIYEYCMFFNYFSVVEQSLKHTTNSLKDFHFFKVFSRVWMWI